VATNEAGEVLLNRFLDAAGGSWSGVTLSDDLRTLFSWALDGAQTVQVDKSNPARANSDSESGALSTAVSAVFENAVGFAPLARAIFGLFTDGGPAQAVPSLSRYIAPPAFRFEAANGPDATIFGVDYGEDGLPRLVGRQPGEPVSRQPSYEAGVYAGNTGRVPPTELSTPARNTSSSGPAQITIQVQTIDSKSFLDHKDEIAGAVREAMLSMHSLNDMVGEL
jgi:hypothetical protein